MTSLHALKSLAVALLLILGSIGIVGCGDDDPESDTIADVGLVQVSGTVTLLNDETPFDGGVTIQLTDSKRGNVTLWFESMFTNPPPTPERLALYREIQKVSVGNMVEATARPNGSISYQLESIRVVVSH